MRIQFCALPMHVGAESLPGVIRINTRCKRGIKYTIICIVHEFVHQVMWLLDGWPQNPYESYCHELWCYRAQWLAEWLMGMTHDFKHVEDGAIASVRVFIRNMVES